MSHPLWNDVDRLINHHRKYNDATAMDAVNRLFEEQCKRSRVMPIARLNQATCSIRKEIWTSDQLHRVIVWHARSAPTVEGEPVVLVQCDSAFYVIDGSNRINKWLSHHDSGDHEVIIITSDRAKND